MGVRPGGARRGLEAKAKAASATEADVKPRKPKLGRASSDLRAQELRVAQYDRKRDLLLEGNAAEARLGAARAQRDAGTKQRQLEEAAERAEAARVAANGGCANDVAALRVPSVRRLVGGVRRRRPRLHSPAEPRRVPAVPPGSHRRRQRLGRGRRDRGGSRSPVPCFFRSSIQVRAGAEWRRCRLQLPSPGSTRAPAARGALRRG